MGGRDDGEVIPGDIGEIGRAVLVVGEKIFVGGSLAIDPSPSVGRNTIPRR
jgi:hypothetical protein